jgi:hypothetical protein
MTLKRHRLLLGAMLVTAGFTLTPGCGGDDDTTGAKTCTSTGGPVEGPEDHHCHDDAGKDINQSIGKCTTDSGAAGSDGGGGAAGSGAAGHAGSDHGEEESAVRYGNEAADDDCKYDARFSNTCIEVGKPVTLTLSLRQRKTGNPGNGGHPDSPEIYLASNPAHISPSNAITAREAPLGTYQIGPVVFDVPGRWVVRFHYFENCSDVPPDSPHGHVAFYVDVP